MGSTTGAPQVGVFLSGVSWGVSSGVFRGVSLLVFRGVSLLVCFMGSFLYPFPGSWVQHVCIRKIGLAWARGTAHCSTTRPLARYLAIDTSSIAIARRPIRCLENGARHSARTIGLA